LSFYDLILAPTIDANATPTFSTPPKEISLYQMLICIYFFFLLFFMTVGGGALLSWLDFFLFVDVGLILLSYK